jgi:hypothetical protein
MSDGFPNDIFISYSRKDALWAEAIHEQLAKHLTVYRDTDRLNAGDDWQGELDEALAASRHLVLLWSEDARKSTPVNDELTKFLQFLGPTPAGRRIIPVLLDDSPTTIVARFQLLGDLKGKARPSDDPQLVERVAQRVFAALDVDEGAIPVPLLLVTTTHDTFAAMEPNRRSPIAPKGLPLETLLEEFGIGTKDDLSATYGATRGAWRPFGCDEPIETVLKRLRDEINADVDAANKGREAPVAAPFRWDYVSEDYWTDDTEAERETGRLSNGPAVVVVDPIAFYDDDVASRYAQFMAGVLNNDRALILVLAPYALPKTSLALRTAIEQMARQVSTYFYRPPAFKGAQYARCGTDIGDEQEFQAWLTMALAPHLSVGRSAAKTDFTRMAAQPR